MEDRSADLAIFKSYAGDLEKIAIETYLTGSAAGLQRVTHLKLMRAFIVALQEVSRSSSSSTSRLSSSGPTSMISVITALASSRHVNDKALRLSSMPA